MLIFTKAGLDAYNKRLWAYAREHMQWEEPPPKVAARNEVILRQSRAMKQLEEVLMENGTPPDEVCAAFWTIASYFVLPMATACTVPPVGIEDKLPTEEEKERWIKILTPYSTSADIFPDFTKEANR